MSRHTGGVGPHDDVTAAEVLAALSRLDEPPELILAALAAALGGSADRLPAVDALVARLPTDVRTPWLLGRAREVLHDPAARTALGAWFTPPDVARELVACATSDPPARVVDPACGGGAFLLAAHERWPAVELVGVDVDPLAVETTRRALDLAGATDVHVRVGDGLAPREAMPGDLVLTNPPFRSQLSARTARSPDRRRQLEAWLGPAARGYVDDAGLFLLAVARDLEVGGVAVLVVPEAVLAAAGAQAVRESVGSTCDVEVVWRDRDGAFPGVPTCAVRLVRRREGGPGTPPGTWTPLLAADVPAVAVPGARVIGDVAMASADFRDAYYLLADHVVEAAEAPEGRPVVTAGLIDPAHLRWGEVPARFAKRRWRAPAARALPAGFAAARLGPKVLVATQSRVLEAVVDADGGWIPSTPVITVRTDRPWHVGAALTSPVLTAVAARRHAGAARARGALKLSAAQVLSLPLPRGPSPAWDAAADAYRRAHDADDPVARHELVVACGRAMVAAFDVDDEALVRWWVARLPRRAARIDHHEG